MSESEMRAVRRSFVLDAAIAVLGAAGAILSFLAEEPHWTAIRYYTLDSNLLLLAACSVQAVFEAGILAGKRLFVPSWARLFKYVAVCLTSVTFLVVLLILMPMLGGLRVFPQAFLMHSALFHHFLCPVLGFASYVFADRAGFPDKRVTWLALAPTLLYAVVTTAMNYARLLHGPYPFLYVYEQPLWMTVLWFLLIPGFAWVLAWAVWKLALRRSKPRAAEPDALPEAKAWTEDGFLKDQDALSGYTYRTIPANNNSCGPVAAFDLRRFAGDAPDFSEVLAEMDGLHLLRIPGPTLMYVMRRYFTKYLPGWHEARGRDAAVAAAEGSRMGVFRYHEQKIPHFVAYFRSGQGCRFFNVCADEEDVTMSIRDFAERHMRGGSVRLIYWN